MSAGGRAGQLTRWETLRRLQHDWFYPRRCPFCNRVIGYREACERCAPGLEDLLRLPHRLPPEVHSLENLEEAVSLFQYREEVRQAIVRMKYQGSPWYARELGYELARRLYGCTFNVARGIITMRLEDLPPPQQELVVSVPSSHPRRGFDSTALLARTVAEALGLPYEDKALRKVRATPPQASLSREERLVNVIGSMEAASPERLEGKRVLLVDDVITTGATMTEAARALLQGGALEVYGLSVASAEREERQNQ